MPFPHDGSKAADMCKFAFAYILCVSVCVRVCSDVLVHVYAITCLTGLI